MKPHHTAAQLLARLRKSVALTGYTSSLVSRFKPDGEHIEVTIDPDINDIILARLNGSRGIFTP